MSDAPANDVQGKMDILVDSPMDTLGMFLVFLSGLFAVGQPGDHLFAGCKSVGVGLWAA